MKPRAVQILTRVGWRAGLRWYGLTHRFGWRAHGHAVKQATTIVEIAARLSYGKRWRPDPWRGRLDVMNHPRSVQERIDAGRALGDCDDHAGYWCSVLLKSNLVESCDFAMVMMRHTDGRTTGHAFVIFRLEGDPLFYSADYDEPKGYTSAKAAVEGIVARWDAEPLFSGRLRVALRDDDGLHFTRHGDAIVWREEDEA